MEQLVHQSIVLTPETLKNKKLTIEALLDGFNDKDNEIVTKINEIIETLNSSDSGVGKITDIKDVVFNSETGVANIDISSFGFTNKEDYRFIVETNTDKNLSAKAVKVDANTVKLTVTDNESWEFDSHNLYDASVNSVDVTLYIVY